MPSASPWNGVPRCGAILGRVGEDVDPHRLAAPVLLRGLHVGVVERGHQRGNEAVGLEHGHLAVDGAEGVVDEGPGRFGVVGVGGDRQRRAAEVGGVRAVSAHRGHGVDAPLALEVGRLRADRALVPAAVDLGGDGAGVVGGDLAAPVGRTDGAGIDHFLHLGHGGDAGRLVDGDRLAVVAEVAAAFLVGEHAEPFAVAGEIALAHDDAGIGLGDLLAGGDEIVPGLDRRRIDAGLLVEVAAVEHGDRARVPWHGVDLAVHFELGALELGEHGGDLVGVAEALQIGEAVGELVPVVLRLEVLDRDDVGQALAAGGAGGQRLVEDLLVAEVFNRHLDVGVFGLEAFGVRHRLERGGGDVPAPDRHFARLGESRARKAQCGRDSQRGAAKFDAHMSVLPFHLLFFERLLDWGPVRLSSLETGIRNWPIVRSSAS